MKNAQLIFRCSFSDKWLAFQGSEYLIGAQALRWEDARETCQSLQADLAVINTEAENQFMLDRLDE